MAKKEKIEDINEESIEAKLLAEIRKKYGPGAITTLNENIEDVEVISTSCPQLDKALGVGGLPKGRLIEIYGKTGTGKTTLCGHIISEAQKLGKAVVYIDMEHAVDPLYFQNIGINLSNNFLLSQPDNGEMALDILEMSLNSGSVSAIIVDSVPALVPQAELEGEMADSTIGLQARMMGKGMRRIVVAAHKSNTLLIFINQLRDNIGSFGYGPKSTTPGGKALPYAASVRIELTVIGQIKDGENVIGNTVKAKIVKNKVASPFKECTYELIFGEGISKIRTLIQSALEEGIIIKSGAWYSFNNEKIGQGLVKTCEFLKNNPDIFNKIQKQLI